MKYTRRQLIEHGWLEIAKKHRNQYVALNRHRNHAIEGINDLVLIAQKLPDNTLKDIFNYRNISNLVEAILSENELGDSTDYGARRIQLAARLVEIGIKTCIEQYQSKIEQDSVLNELTINHLWRARDICIAISSKMRLPQIQTAAKKEGLTCLFNWNNIDEVHEKKVSGIKGDDTKKFIRFLQNEYLEDGGTPLDVINTINFDPYTYNEYTKTYGVMKFQFTDIHDCHVIGWIKLNSQEKTAHLSVEVQEVSGTRTLQCDFVIKTENENVYVCVKKESA